MKFNPLNSLLNIMYPTVCLVCNELLNDSEKYLCLSCLHDIPKTNYHLEKDNPVEERFWGKVPVYRATSYFFFQKGSSFQKILHQIKYAGEEKLGFELGKQAGLDLFQSYEFSSVEIIVPVPLHRGKLKERGYNQSQCIAEGLAEAMNKEVDSVNLKRTQYNISQTQKSVYERYENTQGIFELDNPTAFEGKHILLVDDVLTTGSTLEACAQTLQNIKDIKISMFTLALA